MSKIDNPFLTFGYEGPEYFCDREKETRALIDALTNGCNVTLLSPRRYGKTGLIQNAFHYLTQEKPEVACFYMDIYSTKSLSDFVQLLGRTIVGKLDTPMQRAEGLLQNIFRSTQITLGYDPMTALPQISLGFQPQEAERTLEEIFAYIAHAHRPCYIAIDEFQQVNEYPEKNIEEILRTHIQQTHDAHFIFAGSKLHLMDSMFSSPKHPFYRSTERLPLDILPENIYYTWAAEKLSGNQIAMDKELFHQLYQRVDGVTWYIQAVLNRLYRLKQCQLTTEDINNAIEEIIHSEEEGYKRQFHLLTMLQGRLLTAVAKEGMVTGPTSGQFIRQYHLNTVSSVQRALDFLLSEEYIYKTDQGYIIYDRFMGIWLSRL